MRLREDARKALCGLAKLSADGAFFCHPSRRDHEVYRYLDRKGLVEVGPVEYPFGYTRVAITDKGRTVATEAAS
jgi:hypothetical protein